VCDKSSDGEGRDPVAPGARARGAGGLDAEQVERLSGAWMPQDEPLALDGKTLRGSYDRDRGPDGRLRDKGPVQQLTAVSIGSRAHSLRPHGTVALCGSSVAIHYRHFRNRPTVAATALPGLAGPDF